MLCGSYCTSVATFIGPFSSPQVFLSAAGKNTADSQPDYLFIPPLLFLHTGSQGSVIDRQSLRSKVHDKEISWLRSTCTGDIETARARVAMDYRPLRRDGCARLPHDGSPCPHSVDCCARNCTHQAAPGFGVIQTQSPRKLAITM